jgi:methylaspartate mutase epsilon subunit
VPFSPSRWNAGQVFAARDLDGAVRLGNPGNLPLPAEVKDFHLSRISARLHRERCALEELAERDIEQVIAGRFDRWPLETAGQTSAS